MAQANKPFKMSGVTLFWASTATPNPMSNKYQVDLCQLPERYIEALEGMGVEVRNKGDERGFFITAKSQYPILTVDNNGDLIQGNSVGNGSVGDVVCVTYADRMTKGRFHVGVNKLKVTQLDEYVDDMNMDDVEEL